MEEDSVQTLENGYDSEASSWVRGHEEYGLMSKEAQLTFKNNAKFVKDQNAFIGDTGATSDTTNSQCDFKNIRKANTGDDIVDASRNGLADNFIGEQSRIICDKRKQEFVKQQSRR
eukprot:13669810-Ditylum_brightwellii.AAC.1